MKKQLWLFAALVGLLPIGVAVAEYAGGDENAVAPAADVQQLMEVAQKVASTIAKAREQLVQATANAKKKQDMILANCLMDKLDLVKKLETKIGGPLGEVQHATNAAAAQRPFVVLTVIGQKVALTVQEAAGCVNSKNESATVNPGTIAPPAPPEEAPADFVGDEGAGLDVPSPVDVAPIPGTAPPEGITDLNPSTDIDEPPPVASPMK